MVGDVLHDKRIILGVTGGIAAYKAAELVREMVKARAEVHVIMTAHAQEFVTPLTFRVLSGNPVLTDLFREDVYNISHIEITEQAHLMIIAPATANIIGKIVAGLADDPLSTSVMAMSAPVVICPAMNNRMYGNSIVRDNISRLMERGYVIVPPGYGELACKAEGEGRLAEISVIMEEIRRVLTPQDLAGERILVTAGPTREPLDPVRFITNYSSGKMGYAIAKVAHRRGAEVVLVSGPTTITPPMGVKVVAVTTACEMRDAVLAHRDWATVIVKAAAVADYRPRTRASQKIKKKEGELALPLERNPDILSEVARDKGDKIVVGFSMETEDLVGRSQQKLVEKGVDIICANDLTETGAGFAGDTNKVTLIEAGGKVEPLPIMDKDAVADRLLDRVREMRRAGHGS